MQLILNTFGASLRKEGQMFLVLSGDQKHKIAPAKVESILITTGVHISTDAVELALKNNIEIFILDKFGNPVGRFWHVRMGSTARIRRAQLQLSESAQGAEPGSRWVRAKFENQIEFLQTLRSRRTRLSAELTRAAELLQENLNKVIALQGSLDKQRQQLLGLEGSAGKIYWEVFAKLVPPQFSFSGRSKRPAKDAFNAILNYGYGVLYGLTEKAIILAGLDPFIGFIHTDNYNKTSLVFDVIEKYRIWAEECILNLFSKKQIQKSMFDSSRIGVYLGDEGKKVFLPAFNAFLDTPVRYKNRNVRRRDVLQLELHAFAQELLKFGAGTQNDGKAESEKS